MKKKILIFSTAYHPFIGGAEVAVREITERSNDIEFDMITLNLDGKQLSQEKIGNVNIYRIGGKGRVYKLLFPFTAWRKAVRLHKKNKYDRTWSIMASFSGFAALFFNYSYPQIPFLLTLQEGDPIPYIKRQVRFVYPLFKRIFKRASKIQTISHYLADFAKEMGATGSIEVIPNGVDITLFTKTFSDSELIPIKGEIQYREGEKILITTSRLVVKNGIEDVINALKYLPDSVKFIILGTGQLEVSLRKLAKDLGLEVRVLFLGQKTYQEIPKYLAVSSIFIRPSLSEGMGNSFIEAMAAGTPVIATSVGGIPDFLKDRDTGLFCKVHDPHDISLKVKELLENPSLRNHSKEQAKKLALERYDWNRVAKEMLDFLSK